MLKVIAEDEPVEVSNLLVVIYADPGCGKSTIAATLDNALLLDCEDGIHRAAKRGVVAKIKSWNDIDGIAKKDLEPYRTIVIDTVGGLSEVAKFDVLKDRGCGYGGIPNQMGWVKLKMKVLDTISKFRAWGHDVVLLCHLKEKQDNKGATVYRVDAQAVKDDMLKPADVIGRLFDEDGNRFISFLGDESVVGKDPGGLGKVKVPDIWSAGNFLQKLLDKSCATLKERALGNQELAEELKEWQYRAAAIFTPEGLTSFQGECKAAKDSIKPILRKLVADKVVELNLKWDAENCQYVYTVEES
jgi:hypothetical protein